jgi:hypothetical protein
MFTKSNGISENINRINSFTIDKMDVWKKKKEQNKISDRFYMCGSFESENTYGIVMTGTTPIKQSTYLQALDTAKFSRFHIRTIVVSGAVSFCFFLNQL